LIQPVLADGISHARATTGSPYGVISSEWRRNDDALTLEVEIPPNSNATIHLPAKDAASVTESGKAIDKAEGVKFLRFENNAAVYAAGSGRFRFESKVR
jgi:alpha-L-rhamnosidase